MELFLRVFALLLPRSQFWRLAVERTLVKWFRGLAAWFALVRADLDSTWSEIWPSSTTLISEHEDQFGLYSSASTAIRRAGLEAAWLRLRGGQGPDYIQEVLQRAGFPVFVHEFWDPDTLAVRNPHDHVEPTRIGRTRCGGVNARCGHPSARCNWDEIAGGNYLWNKTLTSRPRPPIPADPVHWEGVWYIGGENFPDVAPIPAERKDEFEDLILSIRPMGRWIVLLVGYVSPDDGLILVSDEELLVSDDTSEGVL